jgi:hypothetical protein
MFKLFSIILFFIFIVVNKKNDIKSFFIIKHKSIIKNGKNTGF